ncbi:hypothetical protein Y919_09515 [Caloranaerobacter azorensis H53214]|uniref:Uncharacterized protein n=2 Tax=Caloranaerobacter azorensis TaxID=116090 RepID=A0A096BF94_9FIRM|nr:hypothetical protein [Caloranaerobacter azorensis]KGG79870.1 hypothetical protein Y919_09515 [Caloranaerobacter azorensis H53214]
MDKEILDFLKEFKNELNNKFDELNGNFNELNSRFDSLELQVKENTQILKDLEHSTQINKAEHDRMINDIAHIKGDIEAIKEDLSIVEEVTANNWANIAKLKRAR